MEGNGPEDGGKYPQEMSSLRSSLLWSIQGISQVILKTVFQGLSHVNFKFFIRIIVFELFSHLLSHLRINILYQV